MRKEATLSVGGGAHLGVGNQAPNKNGLVVHCTSSLFLVFHDDQGTQYSVRNLVNTVKLGRKVG
jgi:hypothetical protein